jgi:beta propeller repeat protein
VISWSWVVCQAKPVSDPNAPWQLRAYNLISEDSQPVDATAFDQLDPRIHRQRVVWQDFRDAGAGEIYMKELETGNIRRITNNPAGQYYPDVFDQWIVWMDNRHTQLDLYGFNLLRNTEIRLTNTAEDETRPTMNGQWVIFSEDSGGESAMNIRALSLINLAAIQMTNTGSLKEKPCAASGKLLWADSSGGPTRIMIGSMPDLQPVFNNRNAVAVTDGMASTLQDGFTLLELWNREAGITEITRYTSLVPTVSSDTVNWSGGGPVGDNFALEPGTFLWVRFNQPHVLDLGLAPCGALDLVPGANVLTYTCFPDQYSAYELIGEIGTENLDGVRMLDAETGRWRVASAVDGTIVGEDFAIPRIAVVMIEMKMEITAWKPGE